MPAVQLDTVWMNDAANPADVIRLRATSGLKRQAMIDGRVQVVAGGGRRVVRRAGLSRTWELALPWASRAQVDWLEAHQGRTVTCRDHRGHKVHGVYLDVPVDENGVTQDGAVTLTLTEVTHTEAV